LYLNTKSTISERNIDKLDFIKIQVFCSVKDTARKTSHKQEKIFAKKKNLIKDYYPKYEKNS
jgi:hypothetical protein